MLKWQDEVYVTRGFASSTTVGAFPKVLKGLSYAGVAVDVGGGVYENIKAKSSWQKTTSDAVVDGAFSIGTMLAAGAAGGEIGALGGSIVPGAGNVIGAVGGFVVGALSYIATDVVKINGKSVKDHIKDGITNFFDWK